MEPVISWFIRDEEGQYSPAIEHYAGTHTPEDSIKLDIRVWNNKGGTETVEPINDAILIIYFDIYEDNALLEFCSVLIDGVQADTEIADNKLYVSCRRNLSGDENNGSEEHADNYIDIAFEFDAGEKRVRPNDLKSLNFLIISSS